MSAGQSARRTALAFACVAAGLWFTPRAQAQVDASVTLASDDRFRGHSITNGDPALTLELDYDDRSGVYIGASATSAVVEGSPKLVNFRENLGFAHRLKPGVSIDVGAVRSDYTEYYSGGRQTHYTEVYAGVTTGHFRAYLHYSPDYLWPDSQVLYGEFEVSAEPAPHWRVTGHVGGLFRIADPRSDDPVSYDWKLGLTRQAGPFEIGLNLSSGGPDGDYYEGGRHSRTAVTASLRWNL